MSLESSSRVHARTLLVHAVLRFFFHDKGSIIALAACLKLACKIRCQFTASLQVVSSLEEFTSFRPPSPPFASKAELMH